MEYYLVGSLRNPQIPVIASTLRKAGYEIFDDWYAAGPEADDYWQKYEDGKGHSYKEALAGYAAQHVFAFDKHHLDRCDGAILALPAGRSGHLELGYMAGQGKRTFILLDRVPERYDVMYNFATAVAFSVSELIGELDAVTKSQEARCRQTLYPTRYSTFHPGSCFTETS